MVTVLCTGSTARVVALVPVLGYRVEEYHPGPADEVRVVLVSPTNTSEVSARCAGGGLRPLIKESSR
ncbi:hypothetical protein ACFY3U_15295 [Micromonospora sp. NPDC000089]|uniref:hypothetical protein n=1 Tax=unclassified Micromonospora TaxID=2617518 RepID=UPI00369DD7EC